MVFVVDTQPPPPLALAPGQPARARWRRLTRGKAARGRRSPFALAEGGRRSRAGDGACPLRPHTGTVQGRHIRDCRPLRRGDRDAYSDQKGEAVFPPLA